MVLLQLGADWEDVRGRLTDPDARPAHLRDTDDVFEVNVRQAVASRQVPRLCFVLRNTQLVALGLVRALGRSGDLDQLVRVVDTWTLDSTVDLVRVAAGLPSQVRAHAVAALGSSTILGERTGNELVAALSNVNDELARALSHLQAKLRSANTAVRGRQAVVELKDALAIGLQLSGFATQSLLGDLSVEDMTPATFFAQLESVTTGRPAREAAMIRHDATHFGNWIPQDGKVLDVVEFVDPDEPERRVTVLYADKEAEELELGVDLIYFRQYIPGFVLVQYKRMRSPAGSTGPYAYRPDSQLDIEIERMRTVLDTIREPAPQPGSDPSGWRLNDQPFYFKLVEDERARPPGGDLIKGMYFPADLFELLLNSTEVRGPNKTLPIGWDNAGRWLNNTQFLDLVRNGLIGSTGLTTTNLGVIVGEIWETGHSTLIVRDETTSSARRRRGQPR